MIKLKTRRMPPVVLIVLVGLFSDSAMAYIGPGGGLSAIGALLAIVAAVFFAIFGFVWYPIKRLLRKKKKRNHGPIQGEK